MADDVRPETIFVVSDGTGDTAHKVVRAALRQFDDAVVPLRTFPMTKQPAQLDLLLRHAARTRALVVSTLVDAEMREHARTQATALGVAHVDLLGPLLAELSRFLGAAPQGVPGLLHRADDRYYRRIEAIEFTVRADDGKDPRMLRHADVILVGVSRTSKTPLSTFLAHKGLKVANQHIVAGQTPPPQLLEADRRRVFALSIDPAALQEIRRARLAAMRYAEGSHYSDMGAILAELDEADRLFRTQRWPVIDVTHKAIEETAATILRLLTEHGLLAADGEVGQL